MYTLRYELNGKVFAATRDVSLIPQCGQELMNDKKEYFHVSQVLYDWSENQVVVLLQQR